jgi:hypothetical protein
MSSTSSANPYAFCSRSRAPTKLLLRIPVRQRGRGVQLVGLLPAHPVLDQERLIDDLRNPTDIEHHRPDPHRLSIS